MSKPLPKRLVTHLSVASAVGFLVVLALFALSFSSYHLIPKYGPWGFDLENLWAFHTCAHKNDPYGVPGDECHDFAGRGMLYPPALYWSFVWLRLLSFETARWIWAGIIVAVVLVTPFVWSDIKAPFARIPERAPLLFAGGALATQFPAAFAIERGNNDVLVLAAMSGAVLLATRDRHFGAGLLVGLAVAWKVYPAFTAAVVGVGVLGAAIRGGRGRWLNALKFIGGGALMLAVGTLAFSRQTLFYLRQVLPGFAKECPDPQVCAHSVPANFPQWALWISGGLILVWCAAAFRSYEHAKDLVFAGATAVATYAARTSYDYNLVTAYPLLVVLGARAVLRPPSRATAFELSLLGLGLVAIIAQRAWFKDSIALHLGLQLAWLAGCALLTMTAQKTSPGFLAPTSAGC